MGEQAMRITVPLLLLLGLVQGRIVEMRVSGSSWGRPKQPGEDLGQGQMHDGRLTLADWNAYDERDQDGPGTYSFGYDIDDPSTGNSQFRQEERHANGTVTGSYGLVEPDGNVRVVTYIADHLGYRVKMENSLHDAEDVPVTKTRPGWASWPQGGARQGEAAAAPRAPPAASLRPRAPAPGPAVEAEWLASSPSPSALVAPPGHAGDQLGGGPGPAQRRKHYRTRTRVRVAPSWSRNWSGGRRPARPVAATAGPLPDPLAYQRL